jgi:hypothetical protein
MVVWWTGRYRVLLNFDSRTSKYALMPVDVWVVELDRLADPHPGRGEQPDQRFVGRRDQPLADRYPSSFHQGQDLGVGVDVGRAAVLAERDQSRRRDLGSSVDPDEVVGEPSRDQQARRWHDAPGGDGRLGRPGEREPDGEDLSLAGVEIGGEASGAGGRAR